MDEISASTRAMMHEIVSYSALTVFTCFLFICVWHCRAKYRQLLLIQFPEETLPTSVTSSAFRHTYLRLHGRNVVSADSQVWRLPEPPPPPYSPCLSHYSMFNSKVDSEGYKCKDLPPPYSSLLFQPTHDIDRPVERPPSYRSLILVKPASPLVF